MGLTVRPSTWEGFKKLVGGLASVSGSEKWRFAFRGHADAAWSLTATLDRSHAFTMTSERSRYEDRLLAAFRRELLAYVEPGEDVPDGQALALLARHHGLPSSLTDWTTAPYVAAYFAFSAIVPTVTHAAIWMLDRDKLPAAFAEHDLIDDPLLLPFNTRAIRQRGVFIRVPDANADLNSLAGDALAKFTVPASDAKAALAELSYMTINASALFNDLDGAARTAHDRIRHGF